MREYSKVKLVIHDNTIFMIDVNTGEWLAIDPEAWEHIKENIDQQIADGYLEDKDDDCER